MNVLSQTYFNDIMHDIAQALLVPVIIVLIALMIVTLFLVGQIIVEVFTERRRYTQNQALLVNDINDAPYDQVTTIIDDSRLLLYQKSALLVVARNLGLPEEALYSLSQMEIAKTEKHYNWRLAISDTFSKIAPMIGLMGTLIPLGPGIVAMGQGDTEYLSQSLLVAFDVTICGLAVAIVSLVISKLRSTWYGNYIGALESIMGCLLEKADEARKEGIDLPTNYTGDPVAEFKTMERSLKAERKGGSSDAV